MNDKLHHRLLLNICLLWVALSVPSEALAGDFRAKLGVDLRGIKTNALAEYGWLLGLRTSRYIGLSDVFAGVAAYYGSPVGTNPNNDHMYYAGLIFGYDYSLSRTSYIVVAMLMGYGQGKFSTYSSTDETSYFVLEPSLGYGVALGNGWRLNFSGSYIRLNQAESFSGVTFGFRLEHRSQTTRKDLRN